MSNQGPQPVPLPGVGSFGQPFPGDRPPPVFDHSFKFAPVGIGRRFLALVLDSIFYGVVIAASEVPLVLFQKPVLVLVPLVVGLLLFVLILYMLGKRGATPGKKLLRMKVVRHPDGTPIGMGNAFLRQLVFSFPAGITAGIWYLVLAWSTTRDPLHLKRGWHDLAAGSAVTDLRENAPGRARLEQDRARAAQAAAYAQAPPPVQQPVQAPVQAPVQQQAPYAAPQQAYPQPQAPAAPPVQAPQQPVYPGTPAAPATPPAPRPVPTEGTRMRAPVAAGGWSLAFDDGQTVSVGGLGLVGRDPEPRPGEQVAHRVAISDPGRSLSKTHASFELTPDGGLALTDRNSTNGVSVVRSGAEQTLAAGTPFRLEAGDLVALGDRQMRVSRG